MKIIGNTVGTTLPKPNFDQTDPSKGDYIRGDRSFTKGDPGVTFTPNVDAEGNLSWSNDGGKENPEAVNLKGADGYTPVKGTDYYTEEDKEEMVEKVLSAIPEVGSVKTVQEDNVYTMTITLEDGSTSTNVITVENGLPVKIVVDGKEIPMTWEVVKAALTALDLFNGEDNSEVTGGWVFKLWGYGECDVSPVQTFTEDAMVITMSCTSAQSGAGSWVAVNKIDLTNVSKLKVKFDALLSGGSYGAEFALACDADISNDASVWPDYRVKLAGSVDVASVDVSDQEVSLDVSALSGSYYVGFQANCNTAYATGMSMTLTVKELVME